MSDDLISRSALKKVISEYIDEYSVLDNEGYHCEKWCAMKEAEIAIDNAPTVELPRMEIKSNGDTNIYSDKTNYFQGMIDERNNIMDILRRSNVTVCLEDKRLLTICEYVEMKEKGEL